MQATEIRKTKTFLEQGTIFKIEDLEFQTEDGPATLEDFYPHLNQEGIKFGIVLSQDCDLYRDKKRKPTLSHISIALLEPATSKFSSLQTSPLDKFYHNPFGAGHPLEGKTFVDQEGLDKRIASDLERILNNNHPYQYFLALGRKRGAKKKDYYLVNVSKMVPIKVDHYDTLLKNSAYQLRTEFANKLGWKIANYYGRVATPDYGPKQMQEIANDLYSAVRKGDTENLSLLSSEGFKEARKIQSNMSNDKILEIMSRLDSVETYKPKVN